MLKWIKFFTSDGFLQDVYVETGFVSPAGETTHSFASAEDAVAHCTDEAFVVWDGKPVSVGSVKEGSAPAEGGEAAPAEGGEAATAE